jgi:hypothetical protein
VPPVFITSAVGQLPTLAVCRSESAVASTADAHHVNELSRVHWLWNSLALELCPRYEPSMNPPFEACPLLVTGISTATHGSSYGFSSQSCVSCAYLNEAIISCACGPLETTAS